MGIPHVLTNQSLSVLMDGRSIVIPRTHVNFTAIIGHLNDNEPTALRGLLDVKQAISNYTQGKIEINDRVLTYGGKELNTSLAKKIIEFMRAGDESLAQPLMNFLDKVMLNPSFRAAQRLFDWVSASKMPIAPDGDIYAWKIVRHDYLDGYTRSFDHTPGNVVSMPRNEVDEDPEQTCSNGLHFCSFNYLPQYRLLKVGEDFRILLVKINPANVVAIPKDYQDSKGRTCELLSIQEVPRDQVEDFFPTRTIYVAPVVSKFEVNQRWKDSDRDTHTVVSVEGDEVITTMSRDDRWMFDQDGKYQGGVSNWEYLKLVELVEPKSVFKVGQVWLNDEGEEQKIVGVDPDGTINTVDEDGSNRTWDQDGEDGLDCLETLVVDVAVVPEVEAPVVPEAITFDFQVGQTYSCRDGLLRKVARLEPYSSRGKIVWFEGGAAVYARNGRVYLNTAPEFDRPADVVSLVSSIDWTKPIETVDGEFRHFQQFFTMSSGQEVAVVSDRVGGFASYYHDRTTGQHWLGQKPALRNTTVS